MFGHQDDNSDDNAQQSEAVVSSPMDHDGHHHDPGAHSDGNNQGDLNAPAFRPPEPPKPPEFWPGAAESHDHNSHEAAHHDVVSPDGGYSEAPQHKSHPVSSDDNSTTDDGIVDVSNNDLIGIKQHALGELLPLVDKLNQTPDERFKTLMMMIQASDNHALLNAAYQAAKDISDEKARAQALLDIVNEINYFTQQPEN